MIDCDGIDDSEEYRVRVRVTKRADRMEVDFSGTSRQARTCINATVLDAKTTVGVAFKYLFDPAGRVHVRAAAQRRPRDAGGHGRERAAARRGRVRLLRAEPGDDLGSAARARRRGRPDRAWPATAVAPTSTTRTACCRTARPGSRPPSAAARSARSAPTGTATPTARCSPTRPTGSRWRSRRSSPTCRSRSCAPRSCPTAAGPGYHRGGTAMIRDSLWLQPAEHYLDVAALQARVGHRRARRRRRADRRRLDLRADPTSAIPAAPTSSDGSIPLAGVLDPETNAPSRDGEYVYPFRQPIWHTRPDHGAALRQQRRRRLGRPVRAGSRSA